MKRRFKNTFIPYKGNGHVPHLLSRKALIVTLSLVALIELSLVAGGGFWNKLGIDPAAVLPSVVTLLTNDVRAENRLSALTESELLAQAAQAKADDMAAKGYFSHISPDGTEPWQWIQRAGYNYEYAGENLAVNFFDSEEVVEAWQNSPTHNLNLLGPRYTHIGVAVAEGRYKGRRATFVVQMFGSPARGVGNTQPRVSGAIPATGTQVANSNPSVLGAETGEIAETEENVPMVEKVASSPRTYGTYPLTAGLLLLALVLVVGWGRHHPRAVRNGAVAVGVIALALYANSTMFPDLELPEDTENSATVLHSLN